MLNMQPIVSSIASIISTPFKGAAWLGKKAFNPVFVALDKTAFGHFMNDHCYKIAGSCYFVGDMGYVSRAIFELHQTLPITGALATVPAHFTIALLGDKEPAILRMIDWAKPKVKNEDKAGYKEKSKLHTTMRRYGECLVGKSHYIIPAAWVGLAYNGFTMALHAMTKSDLQKPVSLSYQLLNVGLRVPELAQGSAILLGCLALAGMEYVKRSHANKPHQTAESTLQAQATAAKLGDFAVGILSSCILLGSTMGVAELSPSILGTVPVFMLGGYCQHKMRRICSGTAAPQ